MNQLFKSIYELFMVVLVIITIITLWTEHTINSTINTIVWAIFFVDFFVRFINANNKWQFVKSNPFLLIAIIPFDQFFQIARVIRIVYLFRIKTIAKFYILPYVQRLTYRALMVFLLMYVVLLTTISYTVMKLENAMTTFTEAMIVVYSHLLFFGHRIFMIEHVFSIILLTIVSISGVILQGLALQWVFSRAEFLYQKYKHERSRKVG